MSLTVPRPSEGDFASFYGTYVNAVGLEEDPVQLLKDQSDRLQKSLISMSDGVALYRYESGKWSIKDVVGHLTDAERIFSTRLLRVLRGDGTPQPGFDEGEYVDAGRFDERSVKNLVDEWSAVRAATICLAGSATVEDWEKKGVVNGSATTAGALLYILTGHALHHERVLVERYGLKIVD
ncbi:MAG: DinB family protein [Gemmatimonadota bacterium]|nr:DinB family protein [Gemmatimonadota bacterium]